MSEEKLIDVRITDPKRNMFGNKSVRQRIFFIYCNNYDNCSYYEKKQCLRQKTFKWFCPYGRNYCEEGFTQRAKGYQKFIDDAKEKYGELVNAVSVPARKSFANVGDYIYVPYPHIHLIRGMDKFMLSVGHMFDMEKPFVPKNKFSADFVRMLIHGRPIAYLGGEITFYQKKVVQNIIRDIEQFSPEIYAEIKSEIEPKHEFNPIGKKALIKTLSPCTIIRGKGKSFESAWEWDGEKMIYLSGHISFGLSFTPEKISCWYVPSDKESVEVTSKDQVKSDTEFIN